MSDLTLENERKLHQEIINDKDNIIAALRQDYARLNKSHAKDMSILLEKCRSLTNENENYKARNASLVGDKREIIEQLRVAKAERNSVQQEMTHLDLTNRSLTKENENYKARNASLVGDKRDIIEQLRVAKTETNSAQEEMKHLTKKNRSLTNEHDNYKAQNASPLKEKRALTDQLENVKAERNSALDEVKNLTQKHLADQEKINHLDHVIKKHGDLNQALEIEVAKLQAQIVGLRHDNDEIRSYILKMEHELLPVVDDYYIQLFEEIKSEVEIWSAKHGKSNAGATLSQEHEDQLLDIIARLGNSGIASVDFLRANPQFFRTWYSNARSRIQLVRHVIASFLYDKIFEPFAAGLPSQLWQALVGITGYVIEDELQFTKTVIFHQALGLGVVRYVDKHYPHYSKTIIDEMSNLLTLLLPNTSSNVISRAASKFVTKALAFKEATAKEQALYHCYCAYSGQDFNPESMHIASEETGPVSLFVFPGFARTIEKSDGKVTIRVVKASVVLQSALQPGKTK